MSKNISFLNDMVGLEGP